MTGKMQRRCKACGVEKDVDEFYVNNPSTGTRKRICKDCFLEQQRERRRANPGVHYGITRRWKLENIERVREINRISDTKRRQERRRDVIEHYGAKCSCCGEDLYEFLTIDHIDGRTGRHVGANSAQVIAFIQEEGYPDGYRVLCWNCNCAVGIFGYCPHGTSA
jgi:hypothetical protein